MARPEAGPRRSTSLESYLRGTRVVAVVAVLALSGGIASDVVADTFWTRHALLAGLVSSVIVVMLSVALVNEAIERRSRRRWSVLAQYVMIELVHNARLVWTGMLELAGVMPTAPSPSEALEAGAAIVHDTTRLVAAFADVVADETRRTMLGEEIATFVAHSDELLGRWAAVMLNADAYAEVIDRHVELASNIAWLGDRLDHSAETIDPWRRRRSATSAAVQLEGPIDDAVLPGRIAVIVQLAEELDRNTLAVAFRVVSVSWWQSRLGVVGESG